MKHLILPLALTQTLANKLQYCWFGLKSEDSFDIAEIDRRKQYYRPVISLIIH